MLVASDADGLLTINKYDKVILISIGVLLPLITFSGPISADTESISFIQRLTIVDLLSLLYVVSLVISRRLRYSKGSIAYLYTLILSLFIGLFLGSLNPGPEGVKSVVVGFSALIMAFSYWFVGYTVGHSTELARYLTIGVVLGVLWQAPIVIHDFTFPTQQWFQGEMIGRVTGTFRTGAQLSVYGFTSAGILLGPGRTVFQKTNARLVVTLTALLGLFFIVAGSRRTYIILTGVWLAVFYALSVWDFKHMGCLLTILGIVGSLIILAFSPPDFSNLDNFFVVARLEDAVMSVQGGNGFIANQFKAIFQQLWIWFPFGMGVGRGYLLTPTGAEIHDGFLALLVETGLIGFISFCWLISRPIFRSWDQLPHKEAKITRRMVMLFVIAAALSMVHGVLYRDRGFMLFIGLASILYANLAPSQADEQDAAVSLRLPPKVGEEELAGDSGRA